jgi:3-hydroxyisobutyrate dehydrogenase
MKRIGLVGLGIMGTPIGRHLISAGFKLTVHNRTRSRAAPLVALGAVWADTPREVAQESEAVISVVSDDGASRSVWLGEHGALAGMSAGSIAVECSTLSYEWIGALARESRLCDVSLVDAGLGGSKLAAERGELTLFAGGDAAAMERVRPVLASFSERIVWFGPVGSGMAYKLVNNLMAAGQMAALAEGMALAEQLGLDMQTVHQAVTSGAVSSPIVKSKASCVIGHQYEVTQFPLGLMLKDLNYALRLGDQLGVRLGGPRAAKALYEAAVQNGLADRDWAAVGEVLRKK